MTYQVNGPSTWSVRINLGSGQTLQNSWNASVSGTSGTITATSNGSGNNFLPATCSGSLLLLEPIGQEGRGGAVVYGTPRALLRSDRRDLKN